MFHTNDKIEVYYYRAKPGSDLYNRAARLISQAETEVQEINNFARVHKAQNWSLTINTNQVSGFHYADEKDVPPGWKVGTFGQFDPTSYEDATKLMQFGAGDFFLRVSPDIKNVRFHKLGDHVILAVPKENRAAPALDNADLIEESELETIKLEAPEGDLLSFDVDHEYFNRFANARDKFPMQTKEECRTVRDIGMTRAGFYRLGHKKVPGVAERSQGYVPNPPTLSGRILRALHLG